MLSAFAVPVALFMRAALARSWSALSSHRECDTPVELAHASASHDAAGWSIVSRPQDVLREHRLLAVLLYSIEL